MRGEALSQAYASADVFVMPSETETLGFVVLEAMASGLPVVAVAAGGLTDILTNPGVTGFLYQPGDWDGAAAAVSGLIEKPETAREVGAAARKEVEKFGWSAATKTLRERQYTRAIRMSSGRRRWGGVHEHRVTSGSTVGCGGAKCDCKDLVSAATRVGLAQLRSCCIWLRCVCIRKLWAVGMAATGITQLQCQLHTFTELHCV